jgi:hypothetical protein
MRYFIECSTMELYSVSRMMRIERKNCAGRLLIDVCLWEASTCILATTGSYVMKELTQEQAEDSVVQ